MANTENELVAHIDALIKLAGLDKSESATEKFVELLGEAVVKARVAIRQSHREGLCLDSRWIIAETLLENKDIQAAD